LKASQSFGKLGEAVYEKHGEQSGPAELLLPIAHARSRLAELDTEIRQLSQAKLGQRLKPQRYTGELDSEIGAQPLPVVVRTPRWRSQLEELDAGIRQLYQVEELDAGIKQLSQAKPGQRLTSMRNACNETPGTNLGAQWYIARNQKQTGPYSSDQLKELAGRGEITPSDQIWKEGMHAWVVASKVPGLLQSTTKENSSGGKLLTQSLCRAATSSRTWVMFLAIVFFAASVLTFAIFLLTAGADARFTQGISIICSIYGFLLIRYAGRLGALRHSRKQVVLEKALDSLRAFWIFTSVLAALGIITFVIFVIAAVLLWNPR
jgi:hypothetical protein